MSIEKKNTKDVLTLLHCIWKTIIKKVPSGHKKFEHKSWKTLIQSVLQISPVICMLKNGGKHPNNSKKLLEGAIVPYRYIPEYSCI